MKVNVMTPDKIDNKIQQSWIIEGENGNSTEVYSCQYRPNMTERWGCLFGHSNLTVDKWYGLPLGRGIKPKVKTMKGSKQKNKFNVVDNLMSIEVVRKYNSTEHEKFNG
jgi:hypothetical protein